MKAVRVFIAMLLVLFATSALTIAKGPSQSTTFRQAFQFYIDPPGGSNTYFVRDAPVTIVPNAGAPCVGVTGIHGQITCDFDRATTEAQVDIDSEGLGFHQVVPIPAPDKPQSGATIHLTLQ